jgi:hypothetical protein
MAGMDTVGDPNRRPQPAPAWAGVAGAHSPADAASGGLGRPAWEPESRFVWETAGPGVTIIGSHVLEACDEGCELTLDLRFDGWLGGLAGLLNGRLAERYVRYEAEGLRARSQSLLEGEVRGRGGLPQRS